MTFTQERRNSLDQCFPKATVLLLQLPHLKWVCHTFSGSSSTTHLCLQDLQVQPTNSNVISFMLTMWAEVFCSIFPALSTQYHCSDCFSWTCGSTSCNEIRWVGAIQPQPPSSSTSPHLLAPFSDHINYYSHMFPSPTTQITYSIIMLTSTTDTVT